MKSEAIGVTIWLGAPQEIPSGQTRQASEMDVVCYVFYVAQNSIVFQEEPSSIGLEHNYLLKVRGRKSGRMYSAPIDVLDYGSRQYLDCGRGRAQWSATRRPLAALRSPRVASVTTSPFGRCPMRRKGRSSRRTWNASSLRCSVIFH